MKLLITGGSGFIGTNLIELLLSNNITDFINVDRAEPIKPSQNKFWEKCDLLNLPDLQKVFEKFKPTHVVHLAARTDTSSNKLSDYIDNTDATANLIKVIEETKTMELAVITSTQYVYKSTSRLLPKGDDDYAPHTAYGVSKKITEDATRNSSMDCAWVIIRPTNVWGPWNMRYPNEFLKIIDKGYYIHPKNQNPVKSYAYVKNVAHQIYKLITLPISEVNHQIYYVGDEPMSAERWVNAFSLELTGKKVKSVSSTLLQMVSYAGDVIRKIGLPFPLHSVRYNNMIDNYPTPMKKTIDDLGVSHPVLEDNVKETINWLKTDGKPYFKYWSAKY